MRRFCWRRYTVDNLALTLPTICSSLAPHEFHFPNAACVVTLVDRLVHRSEILAIAGDSDRLKEAQERAAHLQTHRHQESALNRIGEMATMEPNDLPIVCLPLDLSAESVASLIEFLHNSSKRSSVTTRANS